MAIVIKNNRASFIVDKKKLLQVLKKLIECEDLEVIKLSLTGLIDEIEDFSN